MKERKLEITLTNNGKQLGHITVFDDRMPIDVILDEVKKVLVEDRLNYLKQEVAGINE